MSELLKIVAEFWREAADGKSLGWDDISAACFLERLRTTPGGFLRIAANGAGIVGVFGASVEPFAFDHQELVARQHFWYVLPERRGGKAALALIEAFEEWCRDRGAHWAFAGCPKAGLLGRAYEKRGYNEVERFYAREF